MTAAAAVAAAAALVMLAVLRRGVAVRVARSARGRSSGCRRTTGAGWRWPRPATRPTGSLRDLEQDLRTGKVTEADYQAERDRLRAEAARVLRELDELR